MPLEYFFNCFFVFTCLEAGTKNTNKHVNNKQQDRQKIKQTEERYDYDCMDSNCEKPQQYYTKPANTCEPVATLPHTIIIS